MIQLKRIKELFNEDFDFGVINSESLMRISNRPIKEDGVKEFGIDYNHKNDKLWRSFKCALVGIKYEPVPLIYDIYYLIYSKLQENFKDKFVTISIDYKRAAIEAGLGVRAMNSLVYNEKFCFDFKIAVFGCIEDITGYENKYYPLEDKILDLCNGCTDCRDKCPVKAIHFDENSTPWLDHIACDLHIGSKMRDYYMHNAVPTPRPFDPIDWNTRGFRNINGVIYKGNEIVKMNICQICQRQPKCFKLRV